ncbi:MAG: hypothetical protein HZY76_14050 [Anaerolineae bacterium]|nr:MAG: hypothetical protein HZY76_14050 [Anaerolineae bacterium]
MAEYDPVYLALDNKPDAILDAMAGLVASRPGQRAEPATGAPAVDLPAGWPGVDWADYVVQFGACIFGIAGVAALLAAVVTWFVARRACSGCRRTTRPHAM